jgi:hypothetical protein
MPLHFIRSLVEPVTECFYDFKTDVWVIGDRGGLAEFIADFDHARSTTHPIHVAAIPPDSPGMRCVVMPVSKYPTRKPILKAVERIVFRNGAPVMQVVLCGNKRGYAKLAALARKAMLASGGPLDHWHVDDAELEWVVPRSIALNLRGAVHGWTTEDLGCYADDVRTGGCYRLPKDISWLEQDTCSADDYVPSDICKLFPGSLVNQPLRVYV